MIVEWIVKESASNMENLKMYHKILEMLTSIEYSRRKAFLWRKCYEQELLNYKNYQTQIDNQITSIEQVLKATKALLAEVKQERMEKINYHFLAESILAETSRKEMEKRIKQLRSKISHLIKCNKKNEFEVL